MCCMKIINYNNCEFVEFNHLVTILDLETNEKIHCMLVPTLTKEMFESALSECGNKNEISRFANSGRIWVHTPLGGALLGKRENEKFEFSELGCIKEYRVIKIFS